MGTGSLAVTALLCSLKPSTAITEVPKWKDLGQSEAIAAGNTLRHGFLEGHFFFFPLCQGNNCPFRKIKQKQKQYPEGPSLYVSLGLTISETGLCLMLEISLTWWTDLYSARKLSTWLDATSGLVDHWLFLYFSDKIFGKKSNWRRQGLFWLTVEWVAHHSRKVMATAAWDNRLHCLLVRKKEMAAAGLTFPFLIGPGPQPMAQFCLHWG